MEIKVHTAQSKFELAELLLTDFTIIMIIIIKTTWQKRRSSKTPANENSFCSVLLFFSFFLSFYESIAIEISPQYYITSITSQILSLCQLTISHIHIVCSDEREREGERGKWCKRWIWLSFYYYFLEKKSRSLMAANDQPSFLSFFLSFFLSPYHLTRKLLRVSIIIIITTLNGVGQQQHFVNVGYSIHNAMIEAISKKILLFNNNNNNM